MLDILRIQYGSGIIISWNGIHNHFYNLNRKPASNEYTIIFNIEKYYDVPAQCFYMINEYWHWPHNVQIRSISKGGVE